ncbi:hypothetical protein ACFQL1_14705 [Halomicroarcula sp. GCM10025709]|uniref:hypothetical protein n=1 Tax=Halomicroarcula sp. GCM10025709 TaxID=3252669 RepID=UPI00360EAB27
MDGGARSVRTAMVRSVDRLTDRKWRIVGAAVLLVPALVVGAVTAIRLGGRSTPTGGQVVAGAALLCLVVPLVAGAHRLLASERGQTRSDGSSPGRWPDRSRSPRWHSSSSPTSAHTASRWPTRISSPPGWPAPARSAGC